jgi:hypothetical protein
MVVGFDEEEFMDACALVHHVPPVFKHRKILKTHVTYEKFKLKKTFALSQGLCFHAVSSYKQVACSSKLIVTVSKERYRFGLCSASGFVLVVADGIVKSRMTCDSFVSPWVPPVCAWGVEQLFAASKAPIMYGLDLKGLINDKKELKDTFLVYLLEARMLKRGF